MSGTVTIEKVSFEGWDQCYRMTNGEIELIAVADIGPRILWFGFVNGENLFSVDRQSLGKTGGNSWNGYGGHRLWIAPETADITYYPDNFPVDAKIDGNALILTAPIEVLDDNLRSSLSYEEILKKAFNSDFRKKLGFRKQMEIRMEESGDVTVLHRITNCSLNTQTIAAWALTVMNPGGLCVVPNPPYAPHGPGHWLPERAIISWSYTNMADPRLAIFKKYIAIRQDASQNEPLKIGFSDTQGWVAYALKEQLFVKRLDYYKDQTYPDMGSSVEVFTNRSMMEVESLAPLATLKPGDLTYHREQWQLFKISSVSQDESSVESMLKSVGIEK